MSTIASRPPSFQSMMAQLAMMAISTSSVC